VDYAYDERGRAKRPDVQVALPAVDQAVQAEVAKTAPDNDQKKTAA
jgi:hypothetical protein